MQTHRAAGQTLNYFQQSPVRGQLEPPDGYARTGWRYLQCTDTPNELRVRRIRHNPRLVRLTLDFAGTAAAQDGAGVQPPA